MILILGMCMDKGHFVKVVTDASRMNGFFMDDITAGLLFERFLDIEYEELERILDSLLKEGAKITYKSISDRREKKIKKKEVKKEKSFLDRESCEKDCKECEGKEVCLYLNEIGFKYLKRIGMGEIHYKKAMEELHELFPKIGFNKKIGRPVGVIADENGEHITLYKYD